MKTLPADTRPAAHLVQIELLRRMSPGQRIALIARIRQGAEAMAIARMRARYPHDDARQLQLRLAALRYGDELVRTVFGWDPEIEGR